MIKYKRAEELENKFFLDYWNEQGEYECILFNSYEDREEFIKGIK